MSNTTKTNPQDKPLEATTELVARNAEEVTVEVVEDKVSENAVVVLDNALLAYTEYKNPSALITSIGATELNNLKEMSDILEVPVKNIMGENGTPQDNIGKSLIEIKVQADALSPSNYDLNPGFLGRIIQKITGNSALNKYATQFTSTKSVIESISQSLDNAILKLKEDNAIFEQDKTKYRQTAASLKGQIELLIALSAEVEDRMSKEEDPDKKAFLSEELLFTITQHTQDLQQTYVATQQGVAALNLLIKNNKELIRGVERTQRATIPVMSIAFTIATGLQTQKKILELTKSVNETTSNAMLENSKMLKEQGAQIQKDAVSATLDYEKLNQSMELLVSAIDDVDTFKQKALPAMKDSVGLLQNLTEKLDTKLDKMDKAENMALEHKAAAEAGEKKQIAE